MTTPKDPFAVLLTKKYLALLILAAVLGVVISFLVYWLLKLIADIQTWVFTDLPKDLDFHGEPPWWPLLPLAVAGAIVGAVIRYLPGRGGVSWKAKACSIWQDYGVYLIGQVIVRGGAG